MRPSDAVGRALTIDPTAVARLHALGQRHRIDLLADVVEGFSRDVPALLRGLRAAVEADSALRLQLSARALATRARDVGARRVTRLVRALELASLECAPLDECLPAIDHLARACAQVAGDLEATRKRLRDGPARSVGA